MWLSVFTQVCMECSSKLVGEFLNPWGSHVQVSCSFNLSSAPIIWKPVAGWRRHPWGQYCIDDPFWKKVSSKIVGFGNCWMNVIFSTLLSPPGGLTLDYNHWICAFFLTYSRSTFQADWQGIKISRSLRHLMWVWPLCVLGIVWHASA